MSTVNRYCGWANRETWAVHMGLSDSKATQEFWKYITESTWKSSKADRVFTQMENAVRDLAGKLKANHQENFPLPLESTSVYFVLLKSALERVNWREIANSLFENLGCSEHNP